MSSVIAQPVLDPFTSLWLQQQVPAAALVGLLLAAALIYRDRPWLAAVCAIGGAVLGGLLGSEVATVLRGELMSWTGPWDPGFRWWVLAGILGTAFGRVRDQSLHSVLGAVAMGLATAPVAGVVTLGASLFERARTMELWVAIALFGLRTWLADPGAGVLRTAVGWLGLSIDGTTVAAALVLGAVELAGWVATLRWARP